MVRATASTRRGLLVGAAATAWLLCVAGGFARLHGFESAPGAEALPPRRWPQDAPLERAAGRPTLVLFVHPRCPCTAATMEELKKLLAHGGDRIRTHIVIYTDPALGDAWARTDTWRTACALPGVVVTADPRGALARAFGARTSGQALLYDVGGDLRFSGGITGARGQQGDNAGESALQDVLLGEGSTSAVRCSAVYGCSLSGPEETRS
jgi:hypothetical protein